MQSRMLRRALGYCEVLCWSAGVLALAYFVWISLSTRRYQSQQAARLRTLQQLAAQEPPATEPGDPLGKISIPRIGISAIIQEGIDERTLRLAVGHFPESPTPGKAGTVALAGHRDTFFRGLARVRLNDLIQIESTGRTYKYKVIRTYVVKASDLNVLRSSSQSDLTLITCFPFRYIGPAPERFIVQSRLSSLP
jgi:sortase A